MEHFAQLPIRLVFWNVTLASQLTRSFHGRIVPIHEMGEGCRLSVSKLSRLLELLVHFCRLRLVHLDGFLSRRNQIGVHTSRTGGEELIQQQSPRLPVRVCPAEEFAARVFRSANRQPLFLKCTVRLGANAVREAARHEGAGAARSPNCRSCPWLSHEPAVFLARVCRAGA